MPVGWASQRPQKVGIRMFTPIFQRESQLRSQKAENRLSSTLEPSFATGTTGGPESWDPTSPLYLFFTEEADYSLARHKKDLWLATSPPCSPGPQNINMVGVSYLEADQGLLRDTSPIPPLPLSLLKNPNQWPLFPGSASS